ncbi:nucleotidyl transferase AbiEii/AbiGii toxin family protein [Rhizobium leguminosarum]|uniref:nucleotidyl transferase AbiEii/AbiGii toxin family protein n=1 Tax=Rhizobium leguminosarum TaxID=384 RepID=UPI00144110DF|nr:nucleotidyl transferase AbiEii/AbiGii toxin family protein [Rhizobium leguminosarum]MBY5839599.1 nucleotidyl transferase AbiEii/AbiGii toxin family protein [Rhizobium leguminosarum]NKM82594.1 hypothetical protein [Rhizobium leguminosarum bv. viciae]QSZ09614.1 nucleotidyl transferase AbiEii/AbiGii toxin family protein [Rhizobium leguminosarum]
MEFRRPEHRTIAAALQLMEADFLLANKCWFAGGTAIVMHLDEYRLSLDVVFLCADGDGYRVLRMAAVESGAGAFFVKPVTALRDFRTDQYGIRMVLTLDGQPIRFEIVREARIALDGTVDPRLNVPMLSLPDMFAEKLLANADRCQDRAVTYRDAIDLGMLLIRYMEIPTVAVLKATEAYGQDIERKIGWVLTRLEDETELRHAASDLQMDGDLAVRAIAALRGEARRLWSS